MVENIIEKISFYVVDNLLYKNEEVSEENREVMVFGVTRIVEDTPKYLVILIIGIVFNILKYIAIVFAVNILYKTFIGGAHARNNISCFFSSVAIFLLPVVLSLNIAFNQTWMYVFGGINLLLGLYIIIKIAPADTEEVPILKKYRRKRLKIFASISLAAILAFTFLILKNTVIQEIILFSLLEINLLATNTAYKIYRCKHSYESDEYKEYFNT